MKQNYWYKKKQFNWSSCELYANIVVVLRNTTDARTTHANARMNEWAKEYTFFTKKIYSKTDSQNKSKQMFFFLRYLSTFFHLYWNTWSTTKKTWTSDYEFSIKKIFLKENMLMWILFHTFLKNSNKNALTQASF